MSRIKKGFTLVELLCTIVILLLVSAAVNVGIHLAVQNYASSITNSEAHVLCGTVGDLVCDELRFGSDYTWEEEGLIFTSRNIASRKFVVENGQVFLSYSDAALSGDLTLKPEKLLPSKAYPNGLNVGLTLAPNGADINGADIVSVQVVVRDSKGKVQAERVTEIKSLNQQPGT